jgi:hypothetical protein
MTAVATASASQDAFAGVKDATCTAARKETATTVMTSAAVSKKPQKIVKQKKRAHQALFFSCKFVDFCGKLLHGKNNFNM